MLRSPHPHATEPEIVDSIYPAAEAGGYHVVLSAQNEHRTTPQAVEELLGYRCAALIVIGSTLTSSDLRVLARRAKRCSLGHRRIGAGKNTSYDVVQVGRRHRESRSPSTT